MALVAALKVCVPGASKFFYPDVTVYCGSPQFHDEWTDTIVNPTLVVEVLSPSTEAYDRGFKFQAYQQIPSLREYVLIAQDKAAVEQYVRRGGEEAWTYRAVIGRDSSVLLPSVECTLSLADMYDRIKWEENL